LEEEQTKYGKVKQQVEIIWKAPTAGWFVLNTDGAAKTGVGKAGCGGVLRNDIGVWMEGFAKGLGDTTAYMRSCGVFMRVCVWLDDEEW
jgi:hypothetical protein